MKPMAIKCSKKITISLVLILMAASYLAPADAWAESAKATVVKYKATFSGPRPTRMVVADDPSHYMELSKRTGSAVFSDGKKAQYQTVMTWDVFLGWFAKGQGYSQFTFKDGSMVVVNWQAKWVGFDKENNATFKGNGTIIKGTGPYMGIKGSLSFSGRMLPSSKDHPSGLSERDAVWTYTLPSK